MTLTHTSSLCKELWFEYKVGMKVLIFGKVFGCDCFECDSV